MAAGDLPDTLPERPDSPEWTTERVNEVVSEMQNTWSARKVADKLRYDGYYGIDNTEAPSPEDRKKLLADIKIIKGRRWMEIIDIYTGILSIMAQYTVDAHGVGGTPQDAGEALSDWLNAYSPVTEYQSGEDTNLLTTREALIVGFSAKKTLPYPPAYASWPDRPKGQRGTVYSKTVRAYEEDVGIVPIRSYHVPAMSFYGLLHGRKVLKSIEKKRVSVAWVKSRWPEMASGWSAKDTQEVDFIEVIDGTHCGYYVKGDPDKPAQPARFWKHGVDLPDGVAPVTLYECNKTGETDLLRRWASLVESIRDPLEIEDMALTNMATMFRVTWQPSMILRLMQNWSPQNHAENMRERKFNVGGTTIEYAGADGTTGEQYRWMDPPQTPPPVEFLLNYSQGRIQSFLPAALVGESPSGDSGYKSNSDRAQAERKLNPIADNFARADADQGRQAIACVKSLADMQGRPDARVFIRQATGKGQKNIGITYPEAEPFLTQIQTRREYVLDTDYLSMADAATKFLSDPIRAPYRWVGENILRWDNPREMSIERLGEDIEQDPAFREKDIENTLVQMGVKAVEDYGISVTDLATILANGGVLPPGVFLPKTLSQTTPPNSGVEAAGAGAPAPADAGATVTPGAGVEGADAPQTESPAASSPVAPPAPAPDAGATRDIPVRSGRGGSKRRVPQQPPAPRTKGRSK